VRGAVLHGPRDIRFEERTAPTIRKPTVWPYRGINRVAAMARASMAATVDTDHAIAMVDEEQHLGIPVVGAERQP
jgi:hypothetical protein